VCVQAVGLSPGSASGEFAHSAPATLEVVCWGRSAVQHSTVSPASARQTALVSPITPAPTTTASVLATTLQASLDCLQQRDPSHDQVDAEAEGDRQEERPRVQPDPLLQSLHPVRAAPGSAMHTTNARIGIANQITL